MNNTEHNTTFMNDPRCIAAKKQVDKIINHIRCDLEFDGTAQYYLTVLPPLLNKLSAAYEKLTIAEAAAEAEMKENEHENA